MEKKMMTNAKTELEEIKKLIIPILKKHGVEEAGIFGSFATGKSKNKSDLDLVVKITRDISLFDFINLKLDLEDKLGRKVDLVEYEAIKERIKDRILKEQVKIYE